VVIKIRKDSGLRSQLLQLEIALVIDNTGSMTGEIAEVRSRLAELLDQVATHELKIKSRFAVIGYRDHPPQEGTYVARTFCELEEDSFLVHQALDRMVANGGGDAPEAVVDGLQQALGLGWVKSAQKAIVLIGDAPPHGEGGRGDHFSLGCPCGLTMEQIGARMKALSMTGHAVGVRADPVMTRTFSRFAKTAGGIYVPLSSVTDLIPQLLRHIDAEIGKIAADVRTAEKLERGDTISDDDLESLRRLEKKGVRTVEPSPASPAEGEAATKPRIRVLN
jgi:hypothetical protein